MAWLRVHPPHPASDRVGRHMLARRLQGPKNDSSCKAARKHRERRGAPFSPK